MIVAYRFAEYSQLHRSLFNRMPFAWVEITRERVDSKQQSVIRAGRDHPLET